MRRLVLVLLVLTGLAAVAWLVREPLLSAAGRFLIVEDRLEKSDLIVVLSGGRSDERVRQAADLYKAGYAPRVLLSGGEELMDLPIPDLQRLQAIKHGIPESALLFESRSTSTGEQARYLRPILEGMGVRRAIVVTSSFHTRRTRYLFRRAFAGSSVEIRVYPVQRDVFSPVRWWTREQDTESVVLEYIKLGLAVLRR
ncbi:MAG: YdcF family protein [Armatimonadota bacterium]|nr:YdcF family protein [Armatimonadota bacterium]